MRYFKKEFVSACKRAEPIAQRRLFDELYAPVFRVVHRYVNDTVEAEDCVMKGFMKVFQNLSRFRFEGDHSLFTWVRRIMINEALMFLRKKHNFVLSLETHAIDIPVPDTVLDRLEAEELNLLIRQLPTGYRTVFNLFVVEGYSHNEIAGMLDINENTSRTQLAKAKNRLRMLLEQQEVQDGKVGI